MLAGIYISPILRTCYPLWRQAYDVPFVTAIHPTHLGEFSSREPVAFGHNLGKLHSPNSRLHFTIGAISIRHRAKRFWPQSGHFGINFTGSDSSCICPGTTTFCNTIHFQVSCANHNLNTNQQSSRLNIAEKVLHPINRHLYTSCRSRAVENIDSTPPTPTFFL